MIEEPSEGGELAGGDLEGAALEAAPDGHASSRLAGTQPAGERPAEQPPQVPPQGYDVGGTDSIAPPSRGELLAGAMGTAGDLARAGAGRAGDAARAGASAAGQLALAGAGRGWRAERYAVTRTRDIKRAVETALGGRRQAPLHERAAGRRICILAR